MTDDLSQLRFRFTRDGLTEADAADDPHTQFRRWWDEANSARVTAVDAMTLATADSSGHPSARVVLLKGFDEAGFVFYTNRESPKGRDVAENPRASCNFFWVELNRQVRIDGRVAMVSDRESDEYFASRPYGSRIGAHASRQSEVIASRDVLEARFAECERQFAQDVPRPPYWGGYRLNPDAVEFWQGRENRLHDRLRYWRHADGVWIRERLSP